MRLNKKIALITGAGQGIGRATAILFAREGAKVAIVDINSEKGKQTVEMIRKSGGNAIFIYADVSEAEHAKAMIDTCIEKYCRVDILFNNAGIALTGDSITVISEKDWNKIINVNLRGVFLGSKYAVPYMIKQGGGNIINAGSIAGVVGRPGHLAYCASKGGVVSVTKQMALELAPYNIRVNAICPGFVYTPMMKRFIADQPNPKDALRVYESSLPLNRLATPEEIANSVLYLASDESSFVTGIALLVDGGFTAT